MQNFLASTMCRKCLTALYIAMSSRSNALYLRLAGLSLVKKNSSGFQTPLTCCYSTAPMAKSEASVKMAREASSFG